MLDQLADIILSLDEEDEDDDDDGGFGRSLARRLRNRLLSSLLPSLDGLSCGYFFWISNENWKSYRGTYL